MVRGLDRPNDLELLLVHVAACVAPSDAVVLCGLPVVETFIQLGQVFSECAAPGLLDRSDKPRDLGQHAFGVTRFDPVGLPVREEPAPLIEVQQHTADLVWLKSFVQDPATKRVRADREEAVEFIARRLEGVAS